METGNQTNLNYNSEGTYDTPHDLIENIVYQME